MTKPAVPLSDVARRAGISKVAPNVVKHAPASARELRCVPNVAAQSLQRLGRRLVGVALNRAEFTFLSSRSVAHVSEGIVSGATTAGYNVARFTKPRIDAEQSALPSHERPADDSIVLAPFHDLDRSRADPPPALFVAKDFGAPKASCDLDIPVPERGLVVGFDDLPEAANWPLPVSHRRPEGRFRQAARVAAHRQDCRRNSCAG